MKEHDFELSELYFLRSEIKMSIERLIERGFFNKDCLDYEWVRYKTLVRYFKKLQMLILDIEDEIDCKIHGSYDGDTSDDDCKEV